MAPIGVVASAHTPSHTNYTAVTLTGGQRTCQTRSQFGMIRKYNYVVCILCTMCVEVFIHSFKVLIHMYVVKTELNNGVLHGTLDYFHLHEMQC